MKIDFAIQLVETALKRGADSAEAYLKISRGINIEAKEQKVDALETFMSLGYCIRVIRDNRLGFSYSNNPDEYAVVAEKAVESSKYTEPDDYLAFPKKTPHSERGAVRENDVKIFDEQIASLSEERAIASALLIERSAYNEDKRIKKIRKASASFNTSDTYIANSRDVEIAYPSTSCSAQIMAIAEDNGESQMGWDYQGSRFFSGVSFDKVGRIAAQRAARLLGASKITPGKRAIIMDNSVVTEFLSVFSAALSAESVQKKKSILADKIGRNVISEKLNIVDSGLLDGMLGSKPFDDEGVRTMKKTLIENGVLKGFLHNTYTAGKEAVVSTGNAVRGGFTGLPSVGPTNLFLEPASNEFIIAFDDIIKAAGTGIYVTEAMGMHTANPISGEFSVGVSGLWIENGEIRYPVKEAVISGNMLDLFRNTALVGDDMRFYGNIGAPSLLIENIDISA
ncbi:MAG: TldD/PmbA family protein [Nitrospirae bacterium]|nr:TldD/PmbA family protein [Nitrospirota bacterium]